MCVLEHNRIYVASQLPMLNGIQIPCMSHALPIRSEASREAEVHLHEKHVLSYGGDWTRMRLESHAQPMVLALTDP